MKLKHRKTNKWLCCLLPTTLILANSLICFSSCSSEEKKYDFGEITGTTDQIEGDQSGDTGYFWSAIYGDCDVTSQVKWYISDNKYSFNFHIDQKTNKVGFSWTNLSIGTHTFQLAAKNNIDKKEITYLSKTIYLHIKQKAFISGGSTNIDSTPTNHENKSWKIISEGIDYTKDANWSIVQEEYLGKIKIDFDPEKNGAILSWINLDVGIYNIQIKAIFTNATEEKITAYSQPIKLTINKNLKCTGGSTQLFASSTGSDELAWKVIYKDVNYAKSARWWINSEYESNISITYNSKLDGAVVSWKNLEPKKYFFNVYCEIQIEENKYIGASPLISLTVEESGELRGGSTSFSGSMTDYDKKFWMFYYKGENLTKNCTYHLDIKKGCATLNVGFNVIHNGLQVYWRDLSSEENEFTIKCEYINPDGKKIEAESPIIRLHVTTDNIYGGSFELWGNSTGGMDKKYWSVAYRGIDYTPKTEWSLCDIEGAGPDVLSHFSVVEEDSTYHIKWDNIGSALWDSLTFSFKIMAKFIDNQGESHSISSSLITYHIYKPSEQSPNEPTFELIGHSEDIVATKINDIYEGCYWHAGHEGLILDEKELYSYVITWNERPQEGDSINFIVWYNVAANQWHLGWENAHFAPNHGCSFWLSLRQKVRNEKTLEFDKITFVTVSPIKFTWNGNTNS